VNSSSNGTSPIPLLGETIGANLERTVARVGGRDAIVARATRTCGSPTPTA